MEVSRGLSAMEFAQNEFDELTKDPEIYVEPQPEKANNFTHLSETLYSSAVDVNKNCKGRFLLKLLTKGFDPEQIWHQCDLLNKVALPNISKAVHSINSQDIYNAISKANRVFPSSSVNHEIASENVNDAFSDSGSDAQEEYVFDDDSDSPSELESFSRNKLPGKSKKVSNYSEDDSDAPSEQEALSVSKVPGKQKKVSSSSDVDDDDDSDVPSEENVPSKKKLAGKHKKVSKSSAVDDKFFKHSDMEEFLKIEDLKAERSIEADSNSDDDIDVFQDIPSDDMEDYDEEENEKPLKSSKDLMYEDFFDDPDAEDDDDDSDSNDDDHDESIMKENYKALDENESTIEMKDELEEKNDSEGRLEKSENKNIQKTAFELEQEKIKKKIQECEKSMIEPLPWHLTGEVDASRRPVDSLIHKEIDFDSNIREVPVVDNALTESCEQIVKMAIKNKAFNDVERKYKPTEDVLAYKKETVLDQTKSKKSLAEVYEEDYLKKQSKQEEGEDPKHKEIKKVMDSLFPELYALFTHIPVPAIPEVKVVSNLPAVTVEEVAPVTLNDATLLAPEEVKKKSGQIQSKTERTDTDRKRERRKKKVHQKLKEKKRLKMLESRKGNPLAKLTKLEKQQTLKKLKQHKNTKIASVDEGGKIKSSKDFFTRLQDTVDSKNKTKTQNSKKTRVK